LVENNESFSIELKIKKQDTGEIVDILCIANYDDKERRLYGVVQDISVQKRMRQALADSEALYKAVLNSTPDIITTTDVAGNIIITSPSAIQTYGYTSEKDITSKTILDFIHPDDLHLAKADFEKMRVGVHTGPNEYKSIRSDGSQFDIEVKGGSIRDKDGHITKLVYIARDITERKKAEQQLIRSENEFRTVWENSASGLRLTDEDGHIIRVNEAYCRIYGKTQEELTGATIASVYPVEDSERKNSKTQGAIQKTNDRFVCGKRSIALER